MRGREKNGQNFRGKTFFVQPKSSARDGMSHKHVGTVGVGPTDKYLIF